MAAWRGLTVEITRGINMNKSTGNERWSPEGGAWEQMTRSVMGKAHVGFRGKVSGKEFVIIK